MATCAATTLCPFNSTLSAAGSRANRVCLQAKLPVVKQASPTPEVRALCLRREFILGSINSCGKLVVGRPRTIAMTARLRVELASYLCERATGLPIYRQVDPGNQEGVAAALKRSPALCAPLTGLLWPRRRVLSWSTGFFRSVSSGTADGLTKAHASNLLNRSPSFSSPCEIQSIVHIWTTRTATAWQHTAATSARSSKSIQQFQKGCISSISSLSSTGSGSSAS